MKYKLYWVKWVDATMSSGWMPAKDYEVVPNYIESVGWVIKETKDYICLALSWSTLNQIADVMEIPKRWIKGKKRLHLK